MLPRGGENSECYLEVARIRGKLTFESPLDYRHYFKGSLVSLGTALEVENLRTRNRCCPAQGAGDGGEDENRCEHGP